MKRLDSLRPPGTAQVTGGPATVQVHGWPVLVVVHDAVGEWHLLADHPYHLTRLPAAARGPEQRTAWSQVVAEDPRLRELLGLPRGWVAVRSGSGGPWRRSPG